jgi:hypothetical protein
MAWCDWLAAIWAFVVCGSMSLAVTPDGWTDAPVVRLMLILIVPVWVILRMVDAMVGGPGRRRGKRSLALAWVQHTPPSAWGANPMRDITPPHDPDKCPWGSIGGIDTPTRNARGQFVRTRD